MEIKELSNFLGNHCRFKFRNGKDVYGVIWENNAQFFFSSKERHDSLLMKESESSSDDFDEIDPTDIILAEKILEENV